MKGPFPQTISNSIMFFLRSFIFVNIFDYNMFEVLLIIAPSREAPYHLDSFGRVNKKGQEDRQNESSQSEYGGRHTIAY